VQDLVAAVGRLVDDTELRRRLAKSSPMRIAEKYNLQKNVNGLAEVLTAWMTSSDDPTVARR
jgi:hypothetical protein